MKSIIKFIEKIEKIEKTEKNKILIIGDSMIDQYYQVNVERISPEFPIPIHLSASDKPYNVCGGAANVIHQIKSLNINSCLSSFFDNELKSCLNNNKINFELSIRIRGSTPKKKRFYNNDILVNRWDVEKENYGLNENELDNKCFELYEIIKNKINLFDVVIYSDYNKGVFSNHLHSLIKLSKISIVDSKSGDLNRWIGCTIFKPNMKEALEFTGCKTITDAGKKLLNLLKCNAVIITEGASGATIFENNKISKIKPYNEILPAKSVVGAGDIFTAFLGMAINIGMDIVDAAEIAFNAGVFYVKNKYNKPVQLKDMKFFKNKETAKFASIEELKNIDQLIMTNGCFDVGLTANHIKSLKYAKSLGNKLVVALNSDKSVEKLKGFGRPILPLEDRIQILSELECVDYVITFEDETPLELIKQIMPTLIVKGGDYQPENVAGFGIVPIHIHPIWEGISTTEKIQKCKNIDFSIYKKLE